jgi:hypothetical protein
VHLNTTLNIIPKDVLLVVAVSSCGVGGCLGIIGVGRGVGDGGCGVWW